MLGNLEAPGSLCVNKAQDRKEFRNLPSVVALMSMDRYKYFAYTGRKGSTFNKSLGRWCSHNYMKCKFENCTYEIKNTMLDMMNHVGKHLEIWQHCIYCEKRFTLEGLRKHYNNYGKISGCSGVPLVHALKVYEKNKIFKGEKSIGP